MSDDIDDFLAGLDSLASTSILNPLMNTSSSQLTQEVTLTSDHLRTGGRNASATAGPATGVGKKRGRGSEGNSPTSVTAPPSSFSGALSAPSSQRPSSSSGWACASCTYLNPSSTSIACDMCGSRRVVVVETPQGQWACPVCTCLNSDALSACEACGCEHGNERSSVVCRCGCVNKSTATKCKACKASIRGAKAAVATGVSSTAHSQTEPSAAANEEPLSNATTNPSTQAASTVNGDEDPLANDMDYMEEGSESSESDYGSDADSMDEEAMDAAMTTHQVGTFLDAIPSVNTEHILPANPPNSMAHCGLKHFQLQAVRWMIDRERLSTYNLQPFSMVCKGGLLADYMGLGKTRTIIALCESEKVGRRDRMISDRVDSAATLIVCPVSVMSQWRDEIKRTVKPTPRVLIYYGAQRKQSIFQVAQEYDYVISSYHSLAYEFDHCPTKKIFRIQWHRVVMDEAHWIRNRGTHIARACTTLNAYRRWVVTATPIQNRLSDLEPLIAFLRLPGFCEHAWWRAGVDEHIIKCLQAILSTIMLRRTPDTMINGVRILDLPPKEIINIEDKLSEEEQQFLKDLKNRVNHRLHAAAEMQDHLRTYAHAFEMLVRCRQACLHRNIVIESLRAKMGMTGTQRGAAEALGEHQRKHRDALQREEDAKNMALLNAEEAKKKQELLAVAELEAFVKLIKKKLTDSGNAFSKSVMEAIENKTAFEEECVICLDNMKSPCVLPCGHMFCHECIKTCLEAANRCPNCKVKATAHKLIRIPASVHGLGEDSTAEEGDTAGKSGKKSKRGAASEEEEIDERAFNRWLEVDPGHLNMWPESDRTRRIRELVQGTADDERVLVLSSFVSYLRSLEHHLTAAGITSCFMDGSMNPQKRQGVIVNFTQAQGGPKVMLASIGTCGVGLNLTRASMCILAEPTWNPGVEEQAVNRIHRLGQTKPVKIIRFSAADTIEKAMSDLCEAKRKLGERLTNSRMTRDDIIAILHRFTQGPQSAQGRGRDTPPPDAATAAAFDAANIVRQR